MVNKTTFTKWMEDNWEKDNIFPPALDPQQAIYFLADYLLPEDYYIVNPISTKQCNVEMVNDILLKYSAKYRKEKNKVRKESKRKRKILDWIKDVAGC